jgi:peroxin-5
LFKEGNMDAAIAAFEAALDASDAVDVSRSEIWQFLGVAHAECDNDMSAIAALSHAVQEDPSNLDALLELGVSYTNELDRLHALSILRSWFANHPDYAGLVEGTQQGEGSSTGSSLESEVSSLCDRALQMNPSDPDIHSLVGVLNAASGRHGEAVASFKEALKAHPRDYSLWNKIGATLANSSSSTDAIQAYRRALELKPRYARGWINMGISFSNVGDFPEAVRSYAQGLKIAPSASHVWDYLLIAFTCMGRTDLLDGCSAHDFSVLQEFL